MTKQMKYIPISLFLLLLTAACGEELSEREIQTSTPIVESYLEAGKNSLSVKLYTMEVYLGEDFILSKPITGLNLYINNRELQETTAGTYFLDLGTDTIRAREEYQLTFDYQSKTIQGSTLVPSPVANLTIEPTYLVSTASSYFWNRDDTTEVVLTWDDPDHSYYQIYIESPTSNTTNTPGGQVFGRRMMQPFQGSNYAIRAMELPTIGGYWIYVYRVNKDYVELYERISSTDLANPVSFIENALGIFTSMSMARVRFQVYESE
jgi:hypothetical protein